MAVKVHVLILCIVIQAVAVHEAVCAVEIGDVSCGGMPTFQEITVVGDEKVAQELRLTPDQAKLIERLKEEYRSAVRNGRPKPLSPGATDLERSKYSGEWKVAMVAIENKCHRKLMDVLEQEQRVRLRQIMRQFDVAAALACDSIVIERLQLKAEQKAALHDVAQRHLQEMRKARQLNIAQRISEDVFAIRQDEEEAKRNERALKVLTEEQKTEWSELVGERFDVEALRPRVDLREAYLRP